MPQFLSDGVMINYETEGEGDPILLIHGFASNGRVNWVDTGWVRLLARAGRQVVIIDNRGHGRSGKLYETPPYATIKMAKDAKRLLDHLGFDRADVMGYSMGARIAAVLAINYPEHVRSLILAGLAENMINGVPGDEAIARALEADSLEQITDPQARAFRIFAENTKSDLRALAACIRVSRQRLSVEELGQIRARTLIAVGSRDDIAGAPEPLQDAIPGSEILPVPDRDHMRTVGDRVYKEGVISFLDQNRHKEREFTEKAAPSGAA
ncbi:pimeloyl-ACP methyl ester carboxylesterase [Rhodoligotrophos appendicifer]|uniref:alpha/beta fold hydrolase n=1 Tax=Rhodoligotrophos appendicifer TaxID=987056 RepID=UPI001FE7B102|nr:alpha/beta hydrolase [Rhodoligotrophos appendicifer]